MKRIAYFWMICILFGCSTQQEREDELLWEYYATFSYRPDQMQALLKRARSEDTRRFIEGLVYLERYDFDSANRVIFLDSAQVVFEDLAKRYEDNYKGYLGLALTFTERGRAEIDTAKRSQYFSSSFRNYRKAHSFRPGFEPILYYWARAKYNEDKSVLIDSAISLLEQAIRSRPTFFKAHERSAEYLAHYKTLAASSNQISKQMKNMYPDQNERIKYHFTESLAGDSSWFETYNGIAEAHDVYTIYERVHFLEKGIAIARAKKNKDTTGLITKRNEILIRELFNHDVLLDEFVSKGKLMDKEITGLLEVYYYQHDLLRSEEDKKRLEEIMQSIAPTPMARYLSAMSLQNTNGLVRNLDELIRDTPSAGFRQKLELEKAKALWRRGQSAKARVILERLVEDYYTEIREQSTYSEVGERSEALLDYINRK